MRPWLLLPLLLLNAYMALASDNGSDAREWLTRMSQAFKQQNYQGVVIYGDNRQWQTMLIVHGVINGVEHEKLIHLTGAPRELIRHGPETSDQNNGQSIHLGPPLPAPLKAYNADSDIGKYYSFRLGGRDRIAGHYTQQVDVSPKDSDRYGYRLWLDLKTGLLLRSDMLNNQQRVLERFQFAQVSIGIPVTERAFQADGPKIEGSHSSPEDEVFNTAGLKPKWLPGWVPAGFVMMAAGRLQADNQQDQEPLRLMYSDGLAAFTVFVDTVNSDGLPEMVSQWGATSAVVRYRNHNAVRYRITAVGELPPMTMTRIAASVEYQQPDAKQDSAGEGQ